MSTEATQLPDYAHSLELFHRAFQSELRDLIASLPLKSNARVLDLACGNGFYTGLLAERVPDGEAVGVDLSEAYLHQAEETNPQPAARFVEGEANALPFRDDSFDLSWCAHSLISLPQVDRVLAELVRVTRPGGIVAILEEDLMHNLILPWPTELELKIQKALHDDAVRRYDELETVSQGRQLGDLLVRAGLDPEEKRTLAWDRLAPLAEADRAFLVDQLRQIRDRAGADLDPNARNEINTLIDDQWPPGWSSEGGFEFTYLGMLSSGRV